MRIAPQSMGAGRQSSRSVATACAATPSSRPTKPMPSPVVALTLTWRVGDLERGRQVVAHLVLARAGLRALHDDRRVDVLDRHPALGEHRRDGAQQRERVGAAPALVGVREVRADVVEPGGAEQRVDDRVREHVRVGVPGEPEQLRVLQAHAAEDQRTARLEPVRVPSDARPHARHAAIIPAGAVSWARSAASRRSRPSNTASSVTPASASSASAVS